MPFLRVGAGNCSLGRIIATISCASSAMRTFSVLLASLTATSQACLTISLCTSACSSEGSFEGSLFSSLVSCFVHVSLYLSTAFSSVANCDCIVPHLCHPRPSAEGPQISMSLIRVWLSSCKFHLSGGAPALGVCPRCVGVLPSFFSPVPFRTMGWVAWPSGALFASRFSARAKELFALAIFLDV